MTFLKARCVQHLAIAGGAAAMLFVAAPGPGLAQDNGEDGGSDCVFLRNINGYSVIDDEHLILRGSASRYYLVTTRTRCSGLRFGARIGTTLPDNGRVCPPFIEYVIPDDGWRCSIDTVEEVESEDAARALVEERAATEEE